LWEGDLPFDSLFGDKYRQVFCEAKPLIDYAFEVDRAGFVRVWCFDRYLPSVIDMTAMNGRPDKGKFYPVDDLLSETDKGVAGYLSELGWQVRFTVKSIRRLEFIVLAVLSAEGALLEESEECKLRALEAREIIHARDLALVEI
jgi:hypothetical protein